MKLENGGGIEYRCEVANGRFVVQLDPTGFWCAVHSESCRKLRRKLRGANKR